MDELSPKTFEESKVIEKACTWYDRQCNLVAAPQHEKAREAGRYKESSKDLAQAVVMLRRKASKAGGRP